MSHDFDFTEEVRGLQVPTLVAAADADMAPPSHYVEVFGLLDGGQRDGGWMGEGRPKGGHALAIIPGTTHYDVGESPLFAAVVLDFLDERHGAEPGSAGGARGRLGRGRGRPVLGLRRQQRHDQGGRHDAGRHAHAAENEYLSASQPASSGPMTAPEVGRHLEGGDHGAAPAGHHVTDRRARRDREERRGDPEEAHRDDVDAERLVDGEGAEAQRAERRTGDHPRPAGRPGR